MRNNAEYQLNRLIDSLEYIAASILAWDEDAVEFDSQVKGGLYSSLENIKEELKELSSQIYVPAVPPHHSE